MIKPIAIPMYCMKKSVKCLISFLLMFVTMISLCSCGNPKYADMKRYLNTETDNQVVSIEEWIYNEEYKSVLLCIRLKRDSTPSLKDLNDLRIALNEYMQQEGGYLDQGWQISIYIDEQMNGSAIGERYAVMANFESGTMGSDGTYKYEIADYLNTFQFFMDSDDAQYISLLNDVEYILVVGKYNDPDLIDETIEQFRSLSNLKEIIVTPDWYEAFACVEFDCEIIENKYFDGRL